MVEMQELQGSTGRVTNWINKQTRKHKVFPPEELQYLDK